MTVATSKLYTTQSIEQSGELVTAPVGTGSVTPTGRQAMSLPRYVNNDARGADDHRDADTSATRYGEKHQALTSCRDGSAVSPMF